MKKHVMIFVLTLSLVMSLLPLAAFATEVETTEETGAATTSEITEDTTEPGRGEFQCGEDMEWQYDSGILIIVGTGEMDDYEKGQEPWCEYKDSITTLIFDGEISYIGAYAFYDYDKLTEVDFGTALYEIGSYAFYDCDGLTEIHLPATFKIFGERCFSGASKLAAIHCEGKFPSFRESCLWDVYCKIYFPVKSPWSVTYIQQLEEAFKGRIEFLASDGSDPYVPEEETEETTAATTAPTEATTVATEAPTQATEDTTGQTVEETTEATVEIQTQPESAATEPETTQAEETEEETAEEETKSTSKAWIGVLVVVGVLVVLNVGALLFRRPKGGKYRNR